MEPSRRAVNPTRTHRGTPRVCKIECHLPTLIKGKENAKRMHTVVSPSNSIKGIQRQLRTCPACEQRHDISNCYYVNTNLETPTWFKPRKNIMKLVLHKLKHEPDLQRAVDGVIQGAKRPRMTIASRSITPHIKSSQTLDPAYE